MDPVPFLAEAARRRTVAAVISLTASTSLAPQRYEQYLLGLYQTGSLTIDEVLELLDLSIYHILYCSKATSPPTQAELQILLEQSRTYNAEHQLTGLLLHSAGRYVQLLEGKEADVRSLFVRIQQDARHTQLVTLSKGPGPQRWYADWQMGFGELTPCLFDNVLEGLSNQKPVAVEEAHLQTLLHAFSLPELRLG